MDLDTKFDILLTEVKKICNKIDDNFEKIEKRLDNIEKRLDNLEVRMDSLEARMDNLEARMDSLEARMDSLEVRMDNNELEHKTITNYLLQAEKERKEQQIIYTHEYTRLNDLIAKNSFRISNLEQHFNQI